MNDTSPQTSPRQSRSIGRTILALLVLAAAAWLFLHFIVGIIAWLGGIIVIVLAVVAIIWAMRILL